MSALRSAFGKRDAAIFPGALAVPVPGSFRSSSSGADVTDQTALSLMTFFAGVRIIADSITFLPLRAVKILNDGTRSPLPVSPCQIVSPFAVFSLQEGISQIITSLILRGNAYLYAVAWDGAMNPIVWRILTPDQVIVDWNKAGQRQYKINNVLADPSRMTHIVGPRYRVGGCGGVVLQEWHHVDRHYFG